MSRQQKIVIVVAGVVVVAALVGGGLWWHQREQRQQQQLASQRQTEDSGSAPGGLSVLGAASDLGQLGVGGGQSGQGSGGGSSNNNSGDSSLDPAQFAQYDKYKNEKNALFGEIQPGNGPALAAGQKASIYYRAWLTNGALIDQSPVSASGQRQSYTLTLGGHQVIPGLEQGIAGMKAGGHRLVIVPPAVGYGAEGQGAVPPNAVLIFEVELLKVQ